MTPEEYQKLALRTLNPKLSYEQRLGNAAMGIAGESGEIVDAIKKYLYHSQDKPLNVEKLKDECGDLLWYVSLLLTQIDTTIEEVMQANIAKLEARHGNGFVARYSSDSGVSE